MTFNHSQMRLYSRTGSRLYLSPSERKTFRQKLIEQETLVKLLGETLLCTGCRLSEALALKRVDVQRTEATLAIRSLKKRNTGHIREIPIPKPLASALAELATRKNSNLFPISRTTAWRRIKAVMQLAGISGEQATAKGLRHSFGVTAALNNIPITLVQKWMGHADMRTTAIYSQIVGAEERAMAGRIWNCE